MLELNDKQALELESHLIRNDLSYMIRKTFGAVDPGSTYSHNWHIDLICDYLMAVSKRDIKRLIINVPPRTLKSICVNVAWPAWLLGHDPQEKIISSSVTEPLAIKMSTDTRLVMTQPWYQAAFPETVIARDQNEKKRFKTDKQGERRAVSFGGKVIGEGGNVLIVDDPHDPEGTESEVQRKTALDWFDLSFSTRINDSKRAVMVVIMQRLHQNDLTGHLLERGGWEHVCLPAIAEKKTIIDFGSFKKDPIVREVGDLLHEERLDLDFIQERMATLGSYGFAGQFQQRPQPKGGGMLKEEWLRHYISADGVGMNIAILCDSAGAKISERNPDPDYTCFMVIGLNNDKNYYILDIVRDRLNLVERTKKLFELHEKWTIDNTPPQFVGYEKVGASSDIEHINEKMDRLKYNFYVTPMNSSKPLAKEVRIEKLVPLFEAGRIWLPKLNTFYRTDTDGVSRDLLHSFIEEEYKAFPVARHDDMLDTLSQICCPEFCLSFPIKSNTYRQKDRYREKKRGTTFMSS